ESVPFEPASTVHVHQRHHRFDAACQAGRDHAPVVCQFGTGDEPAFGLDAGPFDAEPVGVQPQVGGNADVVGEPVVAVRGIAAGLDYVCVRRMLHHPPVGVDVVAFDLMSGGGGPPQETVGKREHSGTSRVV